MNSEAFKMAQPITYSLEYFNIIEPKNFINKTTLHAKKHIKRTVPRSVIEIHVGTALFYYHEETRLGAKYDVTHVNHASNIHLLHQQSNYILIALPRRNTLIFYTLFHKLIDSH